MVHVGGKWFTVGSCWHHMVLKMNADGAKTSCELVKLFEKDWSGGEARDGDSKWAVVRVVPHPPVPSQPEGRRHDGEGPHFHPIVQPDNGTGTLIGSWSFCQTNASETVTIRIVIFMEMPWACNVGVCTHWNGDMAGEMVISIDMTLSGT